jgi:hypothetical protein
MDAERLYAIVLDLHKEMTRTNTVVKLQELINALTQVINQPHPSHQQELSLNLLAMYTALTNTTSDEFSPLCRQILKEMGGEAFFGKALKTKIEAIFTMNQITPVLALQELQQLLNEIQLFNTALDQFSSSFNHFKIGEKKLSPGEFEIGILIPRGAVQNKLINFSNELYELGAVLAPFAEVATGSKDDLVMSTLSSSALPVHLQASAPFAAFVAVCISRVVALYQNYVEIRKLHQEIREQGVPDQNVSGIENYANEIMEKGIDKIATEMVHEYYRQDNKYLKSELTKSVRISLNKIANRIDRGFNIEVRVAATTKPEELENNQALLKAMETIRAATSDTQFLKLEGRPLLRLPEAYDPPPKKKE